MSNLIKAFYAALEEFKRSRDYYERQEHVRQNPGHCVNKGCTRKSLKEIIYCKQCFKEAGYD